MLAIEARGLSKRYGGLTAVDGLNLEVHPGEIFGFLGPNGAGKTTTIRMLMDIIKPDSGTISLLGKPLDQELLNRIGYLPEERGLYRRLKTVDCLTYLGVLKGMPRATAQRRALSLLAEMELAEFAHKKVEALSRGMQQKAQFAAALVHDPDLLVLDEPFQGLDPVNTELLKEMVYRLQAAGKTMIFSTHRMNQVEELCDRILLIDHGRSLLYGPLRDIQDQYAPHAVRLRGTHLPETVSGAVSVDAEGDDMIAHLAEGITPSELVRQLIDAGAELTHFEVVTPPLEDIFISVVEGRAGTTGDSLAHGGQREGDAIAAAEGRPL